MFSLPALALYGVHGGSFVGFVGPVRCGGVKSVSSNLGSVWVVSAELRMPTHKGEGSLATHSLIGLGRPLH